MDAGSCGWAEFATLANEMKAWTLVAAAGRVATLASEMKAGTLVAAAGRVATLANEMGWRDAGGGAQLGGRARLER